MFSFRATLGKEHLLGYAKSGDVEGSWPRDLENIPQVRHPKAEPSITPEKENPSRDLADSR